jgi:hypothetical protein
MKKLLSALTVVVLSGLTPLAQQAHAWVRIGIGLPIYVGPGPYYYGAPYYYPPTYITPAPQVVYQPAPTTVPAPPAPVLKEPLPPPSQKEPIPPPPALAPATAGQGAVPAHLASATNAISMDNQLAPQVDALVRQLSQPNETVRRDAAIDLGRMKASGAVDALINMLAADTSPVAREGAARALGLIASRSSLNALIYAAQVDNDREVRRSAQFAVEVIRMNLRGN